MTKQIVPLFNHLFMAGQNRLDLSELEEVCSKDELWYFEGMDPIFKNNLKEGADLESRVVETLKDLFPAD